MSKTDQQTWIVDFPTLGDLWDAWVRWHLVVPDGYNRGKEFVWSDWQFWCAAQFGRIREGLEWDGTPLGAQAFKHRQILVVAPQKTGKGPWAASMTAVQGFGPSEFDGWAEEGELYRCSDWGCNCGFTFVYHEGEPKGRPHPSPLIQLTATSKDQADNTFRPLDSMVRMGVLHDRALVRGQFIRILGGIGGENADRIDVTTASASSRLGNPITFALQDETGLWTRRNRMEAVSDAQRRGLAGMGGRLIQTTNAWDSSENSVAQQTYEANLEDVWTFYVPPPRNLKWSRIDDRREILETVYQGSPWVNINSVLAEANALSLRDPEQAERFFGNRITYSQGSWLPENLWDDHLAKVDYPQDGTSICIGFDGSENNDFTAIRAETMDGYSFTPTYGPDRRPTIWNPAEWGGRCPRGEVAAAVDELLTRFDVVRMYCDPQDWRTEIGEWALRAGENHVYEWPTNFIRRMHAALGRFEIDLINDRISHDDCALTAVAMANAKKVAKPGQKYVLGKPSEHQKIDAAMATVLAHEAVQDAKEAGWQKPAPASIFVYGRRRR